MASFKAFRAIRPKSEYAHKVAALPYDVMNSDEARKMVEGNEYSFLRVDKAEVDCDPSIDQYDGIVYETAKRNLEKLISEAILIQEEKPCYYIYKLVMDERSQTGVVGCASVDEYLSGVIKKHELTRVDKENDRIRHVETLNAHTGPIFMAYRAKSAINAFIGDWARTHAPIYDFTAENGVSHTVWRVDDVDKLEQAFTEVDSLYIADGHHRNASAAKVALRRRESQPLYDPNAEFNHYLAVAFSDDQLSIMSYNRVVKDLNGLTAAAFLEKVKELFTIEKTDGRELTEKHTFLMYLDNNWYKLAANDTIIPEDPVQSLDVSILQNSVLEPILAIDDPRTNNRIDFIGGIRGLAELERKVDSGEAQAAFALFPASIKDLFTVSDKGLLMPPKSTWFEPKLLSGLFIHSLE